MQRQLTSRIQSRHNFEHVDQENNFEHVNHENNFEHVNHEHNFETQKPQWKILSIWTTTQVMTLEAIFSREG
jgi:hypothetical protein